MPDEHKPRVIIPTLAFQTLSSTVELTYRTAGLAIVKGPVGIGKSFALAQIATGLQAKGVGVVMITITPEIEGSIRTFCQAVTGYSEASKFGAASIVASVLTGYPFRDDPNYLVFIVDEAQSLKTNILELLRSIWDRGDRARQLDRDAPAFGMVLCGNDSFFNKGGRAKAADFRPLLSRVTVDVKLPRPGHAEYEAFATSLLPDDKEASAALEKGGAERGNLRAIDKAYRQALYIADGGPVTEETVQTAYAMMGDN